MGKRRREQVIISTTGPGESMKDAIDMSPPSVARELEKIRVIFGDSWVTDLTLLPPEDVDQELLL